MSARKRVTATEGDTVWPANASRPRRARRSGSETIRPGTWAAPAKPAMAAAPGALDVMRDRLKHQHQESQSRQKRQNQLAKLNEALRGVDVWGLPPNSQGLATLQLLNIQEIDKLSLQGGRLAEFLPRRPAEGARWLYA